MDSILDSTKKLLGPGVEQNAFDTDIIVNINSTFSTLNQIGIGPEVGFSITDNSAVWSDFISDNQVLLNFAKLYIYIEAKLVFDPPASSSVAESFKKKADELEWRMLHETERSRKLEV